jgi:hypothetical protein
LKNAGISGACAASLTVSLPILITFGKPLAVSGMAGIGGWRLMPECTLVALFVRRKQVVIPLRSLEKPGFYDYIYFNG